MKEEGEANTEFSKVSKHSCLNGVYRQPSNGLKIDRRQSEKVIFLPSTVKNAGYD